MEFIQKNGLEASAVNAKKKQSFFISLSTTVWHSRWTADLSLLLVAMIWGTTYVASKDIVSSVPVMQFIFIRFFITTIAMMLLTFKEIRKAGRATWIAGVVFGLFLFAIFTLETFGVANTTASNAGFIISLFAVMVPLFQSIIYRKFPDITILSAILLSVIGTALLTLHGYHVNIGDFLVLGAAFCRAIQMTFTKRLTDGKEMNSGALATIQLAVVAIGSGCLTAFQDQDTHLSISFWLITGYLAVFATMFAFFVQMTMIRRTSPSRVAILLSSEPIFAAFASVLLLSEHLSAASLIGGACIVAGMLWARKRA
ncbi:DMT family transporter [Heyndrickxia acidicola]|uniref:DMT family transporter n=1 Tax=Heyndrickxia acidicola TaxID=209389 RepID=A0ABU6MLM2_9BACI|nr:DMT family transporter [Heyndrickxia acidicola]MED1204861.1 DMT family transporter [Heyndrickxia acidicola]